MDKIIIKKEENDSSSVPSLKNWRFNLEKEPVDSSFLPPLSKALGNCLCPKHYLKKKTNEVKIEPDNESIASFSAKANMKWNKRFMMRKKSCP